MKLCMLAPEFLPIWGGVGSYITGLIRHLPKDIEIHVVAPFREAMGKHRISSGDYDYPKYFSDNIHIHFLSRATGSFFYNAKFQLAVAKYVPTLVKKEGIDIIHSHEAYMPDILLQFRDIKVPIVTTVHTTIKGQREGTKRSGMGLWELDASERATILLYPLLRLAEEVYFAKNRYYITVSNWMKEQLLRQYPRIRNRRIYVVYNALDTEFWSPSKEETGKLEKENIVLYVGRLLALKGINVLIRAIPKVLKENRNVKFVFIGPGNREVYMNMLRETGVPRPNYAFLGYRNREELLRYYRISNIFVIPSYSENMPMTLLEAMSCALPVISTRVGGIPEVVSDYVDGILVTPGSVDELASSLILLLQDENLRRSLGLNARKKIMEKFSWNKAIHRILGIYREIMEGS